MKTTFRAGAVLVVGCLGALAGAVGCSSASGDDASSDEALKTKKDAGTGADASTDGGRGADGGAFCDTSSHGAAGYTMVAMACGIGTPGKLVIHGGVLYWTTSTSIMSVPESGGTPRTLVAKQNNPYGLAVDDEHIYWTNYGDGTTAIGSVAQASLDGSDVLTLVGNVEEPEAIAVDGASVYFTQYAKGLVQRVPIGGGTAVTIGSGIGANDIALSGGSVYWGNLIGGKVQKAPASATSASETDTVVTNSTYSAITGLAVSPAGVYYAASNFGNAGSLFFAGDDADAGAATTPLVPTQYLPWAVALAGDDLYWTTNNSDTKAVAGTVMTMKIGDGTVTTLATGLEVPLGARGRRNRRVLRQRVGPHLASHRRLRALFPA